jgi:hypothetical protein
MTSKPVSDRAEVSIDFPDKFYHGTFSRESRYDVSADSDGVHIHLTRGGEQKRHVGFHLHYMLLADILNAAAESMASATMQPYERQHLLEAAEKLNQALGKE